MKFSMLAKYFNTLENTPSRNEMTQQLSELFKEISADEIDSVVYLLQGRVAAQFVPIDFGLGEKMVIRAAEKALNVESKYFVSEYKKIGDVGTTVEKFKNEVPSMFEKDISIKEVFDQLKEMANMSGEGSQDAKISHLVYLIQTLDALSTRYIIRIPTNTLRLGFSDMTILDAYSWMLAGDKSLRTEIQKAYHVLSDLGEIGKVLKKDGLKGLSHIQPKVFTPILMMKAQRLPSIEDIVEKIGSGLIEPKYDGFRLQVHFKDKEVKLFSRGLEEVTFMYPDIVEGIKKQVKAKSAIFEGEAIGFDTYAGTFLPFQETVQRKRKYNIEEKAAEIPLRMFVFEILYMNGETLLEVPLQKRMKKIAESISSTGDKFVDTLLLSPEIIGDTVSKIDLQFEDAISKGLEGIMIKKLDGLYQPGARGWNWIKFKRSQSSKINDTIDCLVMGYDVGKGKRTGFGIGAFLVGVYDATEDEFKTVAKIGTGLTDDEWRTLKELSDKYEATSKPALYSVDKLMSVDAWVKPHIVVEIKADEITRSTMHTAGRELMPSKSGKAEDVKTPGYALRFPRLERFRDDKKPEDCTTLDELRAMFESRQS